MKRFLLFALFLKSFYAIGANYDFEVDGIYYQLVSREDKSVCVCNPGYNAYDYKDVVIPSSVTYAGYDFTVVGIRLWAFESCYDIKSLTLPETIEWIDQQAFDRCRIKKVNILNLNKWAQISFGYESNPSEATDSILFNNKPITNIVFEDGLTSISGNAFYNFKDLKSVTFPESLDKIGNSAFYGCWRLEKVNMPKEMSSIGTSAFYGVAVKEIVIPEGITTIKYQTFTGLKKLTLPSTIKTIENGAIRCGSMEELLILADVPPTVEEGTLPNSFGYHSGLDEIDKIGCKVYVPENSIDTYKNSDYWKTFWTYLPLQSQGSKPTCSKPIINYDNGKLVFSCDTPGAVFNSSISDEDISSFIEAEIPLSATYNITVYASADGYERSENSYASLKWIDGQFESANNIVSSSTPKRAIIISSDDQTLNIKGLVDGENVKVYSIDGVFLGDTYATNNQARFIVQTKEKVVVCKIRNESVKCLIK